MIKRFHKDIPYYEFSVFQKFRKRGGLRHAVFTRRTDIDNPSLIQNILHTKAHPISFSNQLHGTQEWVIKKRPADIREGDILVSALKNAPLVIRIADCGSIQLFDPKRNVIANIHAGWRGLAEKIIERAVHIMAEQFDSKSRDIVAGISPMLGPCCSYFSDPKNELPTFLHSYISENNTVNLWAIAEDQLRACGVRKENIENPCMCTFCNPQEFHSYRRDKKLAGRFATAIMLS